ncbi:succinyl- ligase adp-forming subunit beta [Fusarium sporotrichioides]|uniref:Succinyl-ligase adp-forming subunit beta n=1 Tax=Fusarium sporotrichioides TaxID=5514 RepID=A0A395SP07_FUSSP|nr:succinyl- ligase adp-forming subunit beta [Fusarium sporotrichioides]
MTIDRQACRPVVKIRDVGMDNQPRTPADRVVFKNDYPFNVTDTETKFMRRIQEMADDLGLAKKSRQKFQESLRALHRVFTEAQAISLEVDLLQQVDGTILCANSRFLFDDDAPKRARKIYAKSWEPLLEDENELYAQTFGLVYVRMPGDIGTVVNGAGLAMATNDAIRFHNGRSANFLDAGGQATKETMMTAFKIVMDDSRVKTILVNIYGGITRCDMIAESIIAAVNALDRQSVPMVVRLQGTNSEQGLKLLEDANLGIHVEADFDKATKKAVELAESIPVAPNADVPKSITRKTLHEDGKRHKIETRKKMKRALKKSEKAKAKELTKDASGETKS